MKDTLTQVERLILRNQYEILEKISKNESDREFYKKAQGIVRDGMAGAYYQLFQEINEEIPEPLFKKTIDILDMYDALIRSAEDGGLPAVRYIGFDGNHESEYRRCVYFLADEGRFSRVIGDRGSEYNSHMPMVDRYDAMLAAWRAAGSKSKLTADEVRSVLQAGRFSAETD